MSNNNNAGMHFIRWSHYGQYDDLGYYDKLSDNNLITNKPMANDGNENLSHYLNMRLLSKNLMIMALKNKIDIISIIDEVEEISNSEFCDEEDYVPQIEQSLFFISVLAAKLKCSISSLMKNNIGQDRKIIYDLLNKLSEYEKWFSIERHKTSSTTVITMQNFDRIYGIVDNIKPLRKACSLEIYKEYNNGAYHYSISYGNLMSGKNISKYLIRGAYLYEETQGKLKDYIEYLIDKII